MIGAMLVRVPVPAFPFLVIELGHARTLMLGAMAAHGLPAPMRAVARAEHFSGPREEEKGCNQDCRDA